MARVPDSATVRNVVAPATTRYPLAAEALERIVVDPTARVYTPPDSLRWPWPDGCIVWKGVWSATYTDGYAKYDAVYYNGSSYVSNTEYNEDLPTAATWDLLAQEGAAGAPGGVNLMTFSYGDATPATIMLANANSLVAEVQLYILEAFDGVGAAITVGDAVNDIRFMNAFENDPSMIATFNTYPTVKLNAVTDISLYITPGAGAGHGSGLVVIINLEE